MKVLLQIILWVLLAQWGAAEAGIAANHCFIGDLQLENGQILKECQIAYRTFGTLDRDSSNVVLYLSWFGGQTENIGRVIGPGKMVDTTRYFVIAVAALGNGESTSPSNSRLQSGKLFPLISIRDMVHAEYKMIQKCFHFKHVHALVGGSMGSMQALEWSVQYPDFMDKIVAYVATPKLATPDLLLMRVQESIIQLGEADTSLAWGALSALTRYAAHTPEYVITHTRPEMLDSLWQTWHKATHAPFCIQNYLAQIRAMKQHDIFKSFGGSMSETAKHIHADVLLILSESDHLLSPLPAQQLAPLIHAEVLMLKGNCGHLAVGCRMDKVSKTIDSFLGK